MAQYRAKVGIDYPPNKRVEAGDVINDLPGESIKWLLQQGLIESTDKNSKVEPVVETKPVSSIDLSDGISVEEAKAILTSTAEAETIISEDK
jgi:hypothetical protein